MIQTEERAKTNQTTVFDVAKYFLCKVDRQSGETITHLKLQKLVYYAQAWHLALYDEPLVDANFQAWAHGPVNCDIYNEYKDYKWNPIEEPSDFDPTIISNHQKEHLDEVWDVFGKYEAKYLEDLTHQEAPWKEARGNLPPGAACTTVISDERMKQFYRSLIQE
ncbi:hypothetical protein B7C51_20595 [Paenibacillus larvae subsp. pulvifaciens]|uniref:Antitoxin SocA-like Panacea domain-containing protein n=2 Tax=Paenibacillus larvae TaxID=1464 RepID=A0A1V0UZL4_9BACL|nr:hypothetical protein B7C51_19550 [Paenibacillus larvae subsp. pulvifaciens]ARF70600.1 hypothetical protein B7C51_20595 [Paenibacillus larvae subsp. pulvifaciens]